ncbi:putative aldouronate transport system permease protein [Actinopolymorpha cephalotaxi]|uniref:ABC-type glycerol-3-phosphate transport system permease component n=1 Tax=Actinopolymorpha cephalotaxi TaxID=504797 RepID=A0A1I2VKE7_9ACTN|nr:carbohydrate ABC transporter permease [Actinopolymorpha cephalotaxi]NYH83292.1 ABC-type glycerol-3-phosphate transport system permease component [Actinopolymorpha cephalotaxi]SFG89590.1 putative aldouronate transport system permease protein [Actinopolymorpha cephalotaxi]
MASTTMRPPWMEKPSAVAQTAKTVVLVLLTVVMLAPFVYVIAVSFSSPQDVREGGLILFPANPTLAAYKAVLGGSSVVGRSLVVSLGVTFVGTTLSMAMTVLMAYGLSRTREVPGSRFILILVLGTLLFGAGIIPNFLLVKQLGLLDTYASLILPGVINAFNLVVIRNFFMEIPMELYDSARMDGANELQILVRIVLPLSKAVIAVIALFYAVAYWNEFFNALLYLNDTAKWPVQLVLRQFVLEGSPLADAVRQEANAQPPPAQTVQMAIVVLATAPILVVYPFVQKYFTKGVLTGAVKG